MKFIAKYFDDLERDYGVSISDHTMTMLLVFDAETRRRAEELEAPNQLKIIEVNIIPRIFRRGLGGRIGKSLCVLIGKIELIDAIKSDKDFQ